MPTTIHVVTWRDADGNEQRAHCEDRAAVVQLLGERALDGGVSDPEVVEHEIIRVPPPSDTPDPAPHRATRPEMFAGVLLTGPAGSPAGGPRAEFREARTADAAPFKTLKVQRPAGVLETTDPRVRLGEDAPGPWSLDVTDDGTPTGRVRDAMGRYLFTVEAAGTEVEVDHRIAAALVDLVNNRDALPARAQAVVAAAQRIRRARPRGDVRGTSGTFLFDLYDRLDELDAVTPR